MNEVSRLTALSLSTRTSGGSGVDDYLGRAAAMYEEQRRRLLDLEGEHERKRTEMQSGYARKVSELAHEAAEALRRLDHEHDRTMALERGKLDTLTRIRPAAVSTGSGLAPARSLLWAPGRNEDSD